MWWNFVGRSHDDIATYRQQWQDHDDRFGSVEGYRGARPGCPLLPCRMRRCVRGRIPGYRGGMATDKTGATTTVTKESDRFTIAVDGTTAGFTEIEDRDGQADVPAHRGGRRIPGARPGIDPDRRGAAADQDAGLRIVPVCPMVQAYVKKHPEFDDVVDAADA